MRPLESALYEGTVDHRRTGPTPHAFRYSVFLTYIDLAELDRLFDGPLLWSLERPNVVSFRRADFLGDPAVPLRDAVLQRVEAALGLRPDGPVRMLTSLRTFGYVQNPVTFYYCFDASGERVEAVVAEITNTPWGERHAYVLGGPDGATDRTWKFAKEFHVSPFFDMDHEYGWRLGTPGERLRVHMQNRTAGELAFEASLSLERREWTPRNLGRALLRHPFVTAKVGLAIYWQALLLWLKRTPFFTHPKKRGLAAE